MQLGVWHVRASTSNRNFSTGPLVPPVPPSDPTAELQQELDRLRAERNAALTAAQKAEGARQEAMKAAGAVWVPVMTKSSKPLIIE